MSKSDLNRWPELPGMKQALAAAGARRGEPGEDDRPPPSTFPMTRAAKAALELSKKKGVVG